VLQGTINEVNALALRVKAKIEALDKANEDALKKKGSVRAPGQQEGPVSRAGGWRLGLAGVHGARVWRPAGQCSGLQLACACQNCRHLLELACRASAVPASGRAHPSQQVGRAADSSLGPHPCHCQSSGSPAQCLPSAPPSL
jgi:hypothetical protein